MRPPHLLVLLLVLLPATPVTIDSGAPPLALTAPVFETNLGQTDEAVRFLARGPGYRLFLTAFEAVIRKRGAPALRLGFVGDGPTVGFALGDHDAECPLTIDPVLVFSTYLGGTSHESASDVAVDTAGNVYVVGTTESTDFPSATGSLSGASDVFVAKMAPDGASLVWSTYIGGKTDGSGIEFGNGIAVDVAGSAYVTGVAQTTDYPTTPGAYQTAKAGGLYDAFVTKFAAAGTVLRYSTYLGGSGPKESQVGRDEGTAVTLGLSGNPIVCGTTSSTDFPTMAGAFDTGVDGGTDGFVVEISGAAAPEIHDFVIVKVRAPKRVALTKKLTLIFLLTFTCATDPGKSTKKDPGHEDFRVFAVVNHAAVDGKPDGTFGGDVLIDVYVK
jgi:hypothetical protein